MNTKVATCKHLFSLTAFRVQSVVNGNTYPCGHDSNLSISGRHDNTKVLGVRVTLTKRVVNERNFHTMSTMGVVEWTEDLGHCLIVQPCLCTAMYAEMSVAHSPLLLFH